MATLQHVALDTLPSPAPAPVDDRLWAEVEPLLTTSARRTRPASPGRLGDRAVLDGILHVLSTGIAWRELRPALGYGSGVTCWRRLREWQMAGVWEPVQALLSERLRSAAPDWTRATPAAMRPAKRPSR
jgi:transposase